MKKYLWLFGMMLALLAALSFSMVALSCGGGGGPTAHSHDFTGEWQKDATNHWKACPDDTATAQTVAHTLEGGVCTVCGYDTAHTDDFTGEWQKDATDHWEVCAVGSERGQKAAHT
ncbi:MAG: hypothetical protein LBH43_11680 [Treponema sp.]|nr:hypothetical protein [Treponema sp.]